MEEKGQIFDAENLHTWANELEASVEYFTSAAVTLGRIAAILHI